MIDAKYYDMMEIYTVENLRDVFEYAFVDCPMKQQYLDKLLPLTTDGKSSAKRLEAPKKIEYKVIESAPAKEPEVSEAEPEPVVTTESSVEPPISGTPSPQ